MVHYATRHRRVVAKRLVCGPAPNRRANSTREVAVPARNSAGIVCGAIEHATPDGAEGSVVYIRIIVSHFVAKAAANSSIRIVDSKKVSSSKAGNWSSRRAAARDDRSANTARNHRG